MTDQQNFDEAPNDCQILTERVINFTPEKLFNAFADPEKLAKWWGPNGFTNTFEIFDFKPAGKWKFVMHSADGVDYDNDSEFITIEKPNKIILQHVCAPRFILDISLNDYEGKTKVIWLMTFESAEIRDEVAKYAVDGNEQNLDRLEEVLAKTTENR